MISTVLVYAIIISMAALLVAAFLVHRRTFQKSGTAVGKALSWRIDSERRTEIISNRALGQVQSSRSRGGMLSPGDAVVVWAQEFLDDDILYEDVLENIRTGVRYLYILDAGHLARFVNLLTRLYRDESEQRLIEEGVDVVIVRNDLTLNNFVCIAPETAREQMYSGIIYDSRPIGWIRQSTYRARVFINRVKHLVAAVAISQAESQGADERSKSEIYSERLFEPSEQIMDFSNIVIRGDVRRASRPEDLSFRIADIISFTRVNVTTVDRARSVGRRAQKLVDQIVAGGD